MHYKGQVSFEYLVIIGLAMLLILPAVLFFFQTAGGIDDAAVHLQVNEIGLEMSATAANAYALGRNAWLTLDVTVPEAVEQFYIMDPHEGGNELIITYNTEHGLMDAVFFPIITITNATDSIGAAGRHLLAKARPGIMSFRFTSQGLNVSVSVAE
jgi:uncharacterized protein (UPF0333 family)